MKQKKGKKNVYEDKVRKRLEVAPRPGIYGPGIDKLD